MPPEEEKVFIVCCFPYFQMKKRHWCWPLLLFLILALTVAQESPFALEESAVSEEELAEEVELVEDRAGTTPDSAFYVIDEIVEDINLAVRDGESKAEYALGVKQEKVAEAALMLNEQKAKETAEALQKMKSVSGIIQDELSPRLQALAKENGEFSQKLLAAMEQDTPEGWDDVNVLISEQFTEEEKIQISSALVTKLGDYCEELSYVDYDAMLQDQHCNPSNAPEWLKEMLEGELAQREEEAKKQLVSELTACINDPRDCNCNDIPVEVHRQGCEEDKALAIRCEFEEDRSACDQLDQKSIGGEDVPAFLRSTFESTITELISKKEKEMFDKFAPPECKEAGVTTREECESIMREKYGEPPEECQKEGRFIGEEACMLVMKEKYDIPDECFPGGKPVTQEECMAIMASSGKIPGDCLQDGKFIGREECEETMISQMAASGQIPEDCLENGQFIGREECEQKMMASGAVSGSAPEACLEEGEFIGQKACTEKMKGQAGSGMGEGGSTASECMENDEFIGEEACMRIFQEKMGQGGGFGSGMPSMPPSGIPPSETEQPSAGGGLAVGAPSLNIPVIPDTSGLEHAQFGGDQVLIVDDGGSQLVPREELQRLREEAERNAEMEGEHSSTAEQIREEIQQLQQDKDNAGRDERSEDAGESSPHFDEHGEEVAESSSGEESDET